MSDTDLPVRRSWLHWKRPEEVRSQALDFVEFAESQAHCGGVFVSSFQLKATGGAWMCESAEDVLLPQGQDRLRQACLEVAASLMGHALYWLLQQEAADGVLNGRGKKVLSPPYLVLVLNGATSWTHLKELVESAPVVELQWGSWVRNEQVQLWLRVTELRRTSDWGKRMDELFGGCRMQAACAWIEGDRPVSAVKEIVPV